MYYFFFHLVAILKKCNDKNFCYTRSDLFCSLNGLFIWTNMINMKCDSSWILRTISILKWNVNASSNNKPKSLGIGGVLTREISLYFFLFHEKYEI